MRTITGTIKAFITDTYTTPDSLMKEKIPDALGHMVYYPKNLSDWIECGSAEITVTLFDDDKVKESIIETLKAEKQKILADTNVKVNLIEERIQSLLAIEDKS